MMQDASVGYKFSSFLVGATLKRSVVDRDDKIRSKFRLRGVDSIKTEVTRELGKNFAKKTKTSLEHLLPNITFTMNFRTEKCEVKAKPVFLYGRYLKNKGGISQKQESCQDCKGTGCIFCSNRGIVHFDSVEGKISQFLYKKFGSDKSTKLLENIKEAQIIFSQLNILSITSSTELHIKFITKTSFSFL